MSIQNNDFIKNVSALGTLPFFLIIISILYSINQIHFAIQLALGIFIGHLITYLIRLIYRKERPIPQKYESLVEKIDTSSFPSLHSVRAIIFFIISVMNSQSLTAYFIFSIYALGILWSRHYLQRHDWIDIFGGALIGLFIGLLTMLITPHFF